MVQLNRALRLQVKSTRGLRLPPLPARQAASAFPGDQTTDLSGTGNNDSLTQKSTEEPTGESTDHLAESPTGEPTGNPEDEPTSEATEESSSEATEAPTGEATEETTSEATEESISEATEKPSQETGEGDTQIPSHDPSQTSSQETKQSSVQSSQESGPSLTEEPTQQSSPGIPPQTTQGTPVSKTNPPSTPTEDGDSTTSAVTKWPESVTISPVPTEVDQPEIDEDKDEDENDDDGPIAAIIPCTLWFFNVCPTFDNINFGGWRLPLPPGIYPPGPPPTQLPTPINIRGNLPPWPQFTVGPDNISTFPSAPEPTDCETQTAELCYATTSYAVSTLGNGAVETVSSDVPEPTCTDILGCAVRDEDEESTATTTLSCSPAPSGNARRQEQGGDSGAACSALEKYTIWPLDGDNVNEAKATWEQMVDTIGNDTRIENLQGRRFMVDFWHATLTEDEAQAIRGIPNVSGIYARCKECNFDPTTSWVYQREYPRKASDYLDDDGNSPYIGPQQMAYLSYPPTKDEYFENQYIFDDSAGSDIPVYIVDTGTQLAHKEFIEGDNIASRVNWMFVGGNDFDIADSNGRPAQKDDSATRADGTCRPGGCKVHGTSMLGFVTGRHLGSSKNVEPWVVRVPRRSGNGGGSTPEDWVRGVTMINEKITEKTEVTQAIVSLSWLFAPGDFGQEGGDYMDKWVRRLAGAITALNEKGVFVVTGSGNSRYVTGWPAWFGANEGSMDVGFNKNPIYIKDLLVVGAADVLTGDRWGSSGIYKELGLPHMYGPGDNVIGVAGDKSMWASRDHGVEYKTTRGTSVATAYTAGMAAYFLKLHQLGRLPLDSSGNQPDMSPGGLKRYLVDKAWSRFENPEYGPINGLWNSAFPHGVKSSRRCAYDKAAQEGAAAMRMFRRQDQEQGQDQDDFVIFEDQCMTGEDSPAEAGSPDDTDDGEDADGTDDEEDAGDADGTEELENPSPICNLHIHEFYNTIEKDSFHVEYRFFNGEQDDPVDEGTYDVEYNKEHLVTAEDTGLDHHIVVNLYKEDDDENCPDTGKLPPGGKIHKSKRACGDPYWKNHQVKLKYGSLEWDSESDQDKDKTPHCGVGGWDTVETWDETKPPSPNRQMDCRFPC